MLFDCSSCVSQACILGNKTLPEHCPMRLPGYDESVRQIYAQSSVASQQIATQTLCGTKKERDAFPRLKLLIEYCKKMDYHKIGIAFCCMVFDEMNQLSRILRKCGFEVVSVCCLNGGTNITEHDVPLPEVTIGPGFDPACNPVGQARLLNAQAADFVIVCSLCAGHDSLAFRFCQAPCTLLSVKDVAMDMCPLNALKLYQKYPEIMDPPKEEETI